MITNIGKSILAKYLIDQAPSYASYIAVGCGHRPIANLTYSITNISATTTTTTVTITGHEFIVGDMVLIRLASTYAARNGTYAITAVTTNTVSFAFSGNTISSTATTGTASLDFASKTALDFEMFRVPIISKGYVNENDLTKLVLTAELPTEERYEITEIGVFSAEANPSAGSFDSKNFFLFTQAEGWKYLGSSEIPTVYTALDTETANVIDVEDGSGTPRPVFHTNADNRIFTDADRIARNERSRFLNNMIMIIGNNSTLQKDTEEGVVVASGNYIEKTETSFSFNKNAPTDKLKLAFSLINKNGDSEEIPDNVKILVKFSSASSPTEYASFAVDIDHTGFTSGDAPREENFTLNRYFVASKEIQDLYYTSGFNWSTANLVKIYAQVRKDGAASSNYYVSLDGMRLENLTTTNPLYGMTGYSVVKTEGALPIIKASNTSNYIEFRIAIGVE